MVDSDDGYDEDAFLVDPPWGEPEPLPPPWQAPTSTVRPGGMAAWDLEQATAEPSALSDHDLIEAIRGFDHAVSWAQARQAVVLAEFARRRPATPADRNDPDTSGISRYAGDEVGLALTVSRGAAGDRIARAVRLREVLPGTLALWQAGQLDLAKVRLLCEMTLLLEDAHAQAVQARVLPRAPRQTWAQLRAAIARAIIAVDPEGANERHRRARKQRRVGISPEADGMASLWAFLSAPDALTAYGWLTALARGLGPEDPRSIDARRADLLVALLTGNLTLTAPSDMHDEEGYDRPDGHDGPIRVPAPSRITSSRTTPEPAAAPTAAAPTAAAPTAAAPTAAAPTAAAPTTTAPDGTAPDGTAPDGTAPDGTAPDGTAPDGTAPDGVGPDGVGPDGTGPDGVGPDGVGPDGVGPDGVGPDGTVAWPDGVGPDRAGPGGTTGSERTSHADGGGREWTGYDAACPQAGKPGARGDRWAGVQPSEASSPTPSSPTPTPPTLPSPRPGFEPTGAPPAPVAPSKPLVHIVIQHSTLLGHDDQPVEMAGYGPIPADLGREIATDSVWRRLVTDPLSGTLLDVGRQTYRPPAGLAGHVQARDVTCRMPICWRRVADCDLDHTLGWAAGGTTCEANLHGECRCHHRLKDQPGWQVQQGSDGRITWTTPTGHRYSSDPFDYRAEPDLREVAVAFARAAHDEQVRREVTTAQSRRPAATPIDWTTGGTSSGTGEDPPPF